MLFRTYKSTLKCNKKHSWLMPLPRHGNHIKIVFIPLGIRDLCRYRNILHTGLKCNEKTCVFGDKSDTVPEKTSLLTASFSAAPLSWCSKSFLLFLFSVLFMT